MNDIRTFYPLTFTNFFRISLMSTVIIPTSDQAVPVNPENLAFVNEQIERVREIAGWKNFGTIGYEAYADWVLEESLSARIKVA